MTEQPDLFSAEALRDAGIKAAAEHADFEIPRWTDQAMEFLIRFLAESALSSKEFMGEEVRLWSHDHGLPLPPSKRAWGSVMLMASRRNLIRAISTKKVRNPKAHCANATVWVRVH